MERAMREAAMIDWNVKMSRDTEVIEIRAMNRDMSRTRLKPVFLETGELNVIVPGISEESAREKAKKICQLISSSGVWGMEIWDMPAILASIQSSLGEG